MDQLSSFPRNVSRFDTQGSDIPADRGRPLMAVLTLASRTRGDARPYLHAAADTHPTFHVPRHHPGPYLSVGFGGLGRFTAAFSMKSITISATGLPEDFSIPSSPGEEFTSITTGP